MAFLRIQSGGMKGQKFEIDRDEVVIGRASDNVVPLDEPAVSSRHCAILRDGRKFTLRDLDSTNGTRLNGVSITENRLSPKDIIAVGSVEIMFDGMDVDAFKAPSASEAQVTVRLGATAVRAAAVGGGATPFGAKRDTKIYWIIGIVLVGLVALVAMGFFLFRLFKS
jgi:predicted component of type VI protein secretion system